MTNRYTTYSEIPTTTSVSTVLGPQTTKYVYEAPSKRDVRDPDMRNCERKYGKKVLRSACECIWKPKQETRTTTTVKTRQTTTTVTKKPKSTKVVTRTITVPVTKQVEVTVRTSSHLPPTILTVFRPPFQRPVPSPSRPRRRLPRIRSFAQPFAMLEALLVPMHSIMTATSTPICETVSTRANQITDVILWVSTL